ncbi:unnamed protein product [Laminaria digitata]
MAAASRAEVPGRNTASKSGRGLARLDKLLAGIHGKLMKGKRGDHIRKAMGAGPVAKQNKFAKAEEKAASDLAASADGSSSGGGGGGGGGGGDGGGGSPKR